MLRDENQNSNEYFLSYYTYLTMWINDNRSMIMGLGDIGAMVVLKNVLININLSTVSYNL